MSLAQRIQECIDNHEAYVAKLATLPDRELAKRIDLVHMQMEMAEQKKNTASIELLEVWRAQIIEARIVKAENNIEDAPNEMEMAIAEIETIVAKSEERAESFTEESQKQTYRKPKVQEDNSDQLSLF